MLRSDKGSASVEFVVVFPFFVVLFLSAYEVAMMNMRAVLLERAVDETVREIRLAGGVEIEHDDVRESICNRPTMVPDCAEVTMIELTVVDQVTWSGIQADVDCVARGGPITPPDNFKNGQQNELMLIRVCAVVDPVFPSFGVGKSIPKDDSGGYWIIASSAFVNEPRGAIN